jgi:hypothetical protein
MGCQLTQVAETTVQRMPYQKKFWKEGLNDILSMSKRQRRKLITSSFDETYVCQAYGEKDFRNYYYMYWEAGKWQHKKVDCGKRRSFRSWKRFMYRLDERLLEDVKFVVGRFRKEAVVAWERWHREQDSGSGSEGPCRSWYAEDSDIGW